MPFYNHGVSSSGGHNFIHLCTQLTASKCMKQKLIELKREIDKFTTIVRNFKNPLSIIDRTCRQKISRGYESLQPHYQTHGWDGHLRNLYPMTAKHTFFSSIQCKFTKMEHIMGHKSSLSGFKGILASKICSVTRWN